MTRTLSTSTILWSNEHVDDFAVFVIDDSSPTVRDYHQSPDASFTFHSFHTPMSVFIYTLLYVAAFFLNKPSATLSQKAQCSPIRMMLSRALDRKYDTLLHVNFLMPGARSFSKTLAQLEETDLSLFSTMSDDERDERDEETLADPDPGSFSAVAGFQGIVTCPALRAYQLGFAGPQNYLCCISCPRTFLLNLSTCSSHIKTHLPPTGPSGKKTRLPVARIVALCKRLNVYQGLVCRFSSC